MDHRLRELERQWQEYQTSETLSPYIKALIRSGRALDAFAILYSYDPPLEPRRLVRHEYKHSQPSLLPDDWRLRRGLLLHEGRFDAEREDGYLYQLVDYAYANTLSFNTFKEAREAQEMAEDYVARHGDIDLNSFPYSLDQLLHYDDISNIIDWWTINYPKIDLESDFLPENTALNQNPFPFFKKPAPQCQWIELDQDSFQYIQCSLPVFHQNFCQKHLQRWQEKDIQHRLNKKYFPKETRSNPDINIRELERAAYAGDAEAQNRLIHYLWRAGQLVTLRESPDPFLRFVGRHLVADVHMHQTAFGGYEPTIGVFRNRLWSDLREQIKKIGTDLFGTDLFGGLFASEQLDNLIWVTYRDNRNRGVWLDKMTQLNQALQEAGFNARPDNLAQPLHPITEMTSLYIRLPDYPDDEIQEFYDRYITLFNEMRGK